jgi:holo-[acyl-carrier protein] synthase
MIRGIGTDMVSKARIADALETHGEKFITRILSPAEQTELAKRNDKVAYLAKRFAAKEAISKALGCGLGANLSFQDITISNLPSGAPNAEISRQPYRNYRIHLSLSDEKDHALAFAVAEE